jgi:L-cystine uptake protein TcyP (sodium:dicarboxylate symporter family)
MEQQTKLGKSISENMEHVWWVLARQAYIHVLADVVLALILCGLFWVWARLEWDVLGRIVCLLLGFAAAYAVFHALIGIVTMIFNPEYAVFDLLL